MRIFAHTIWIDRPREAVFDYFTDWSAAPRWRSYVTSMAPNDNGPVRAGSTIHVTMAIAGADYTFDLSVLACERPELWRHHTHETDVSGFIEYRFVSENGGTRVTLTGERSQSACTVGWPCRSCGCGVARRIANSCRNSRGRLKERKARTSERR